MDGVAMHEALGMRAVRGVEDDLTAGDDGWRGAAMDAPLSWRGCRDIRPAMEDFVRPVKRRCWDSTTNFGFKRHYATEKKRLGPRSTIR